MTSPYERPRIVVVGSSNTDFVVRVPNIPSPGETVLGTTFATVAGGKGANQAVAAARLGAAVAFVARVGSDAWGDAALEAYSGEGINTEYVVRDLEVPSGIALIAVDDRGENAIAVADGANGRLSRADVDAAAPGIREADVIVLQLETPLDTVRYAAELGADGGAWVILNPAPASGPLDRALLRHVSVLTPNLGEAAILSGQSVGDAGEALSAARHLRAQGAVNVVVTMGANGVLVEGEDASGEIPAPSVQAVDTTAAGDAFTGALAVALGEGRPLLEAARFAVQAAAASVTRPGAQPSLPTREELLDGT
ncbi:MAG: ribokinase [Gemmatimonadota bacterium]